MPRNLVSTKRSNKNNNNKKISITHTKLAKLNWWPMSIFFLWERQSMFYGYSMLIVIRVEPTYVLKNIFVFVNCTSESIYCRHRKRIAQCKSADCGVSVHVHIHFYESKYITYMYIHYLDVTAWFDNYILSPTWTMLIWSTLTIWASHQMLWYIATN